MDNAINLRGSATKTTIILYWVFNGLFAAMMLFSAVPDIYADPVAVEGFRQIQMPAYLLPFLGIAKTLGVIAILIPGRRTIKEWAYAGLFFDLAGAIYCILASARGVNNTVFMVIPVALGVLAYWYYRKKNG